MTRPPRAGRRQSDRQSYAGGARVVARAGVGRSATGSSRRPRSVVSRRCAWRSMRRGLRPTSTRSAPRVVAELEALVAAHPYRERPPRSADARAVPLRPSGRGARGVPGRARMLVDELGIEPGPELRGLHAVDPPTGLEPGASSRWPGLGTRTHGSTRSYAAVVAGRVIPVLGANVAEPDEAPGSRAGGSTVRRARTAGFSAGRAVRGHDEGLGTALRRAARPF